AVELATTSLEQIEQEQETINAFITVTRELALRQAEQVDRELAAGHDRGPLAGLPFGVKDLFVTAGSRTTCASKLLADWVPERDAFVARGGGRLVRVGEPPTLAVLRRAVGDAAPGVRGAVEAALSELERAGARLVDAPTIHGIDEHLAAFMITIIGEGSLGFE